MDSGTATVLASATTSFGLIMVAAIGAWSAWRTSDTRLENERLRRENEELRAKKGTPDEA